MAKRKGKQDGGVAPLVLGIVGLIVPVLGLVPAILAIVLGIRQRSGPRPDLAIVGVVLGAIGALVQMIFWVIGALAYFGVLSPGVN